MTSVLDANGITTLIRSFVAGSKISFTVRFDLIPPGEKQPWEFHFQWDGDWKLTRVVLSAMSLDKNFSAKGKNVPAANDNPVNESWSLRESQSPIDDSPQIYGSLSDKKRSALLALRCEEREIEVFVRPDAYLGNRGKSIVCEG